LSDCYFLFPNRSPTCYAPIHHSATPCKTTTFDLHVLSTPPAFILNQDQTLHMNCLDISTQRSKCPKIVRCEQPSLHPTTLINQPTHQPTIQASLTTNIASYHSSVVKVHRAALIAGSFRRLSGDRLYHIRLSPVK